MNREGIINELYNKVQLAGVNKEEIRFIVNYTIDNIGKLL